MLGLKKFKKNKAANNGEKPGEEEMSFLEHLEELRWHILRSLAAIIVIAIGVFLAKDFVFGRVILGPTKESFFTYQFFCNLMDSLCFSPENLKLMTFSLEEQFISHLKVSFWLGLVVAFPYVFWEFWRFIRPGLYDKERKAARGMVFICSSLFLIGVLFGYFVISPFAVTFLSSYSLDASIENTVALGKLVNSMTMFTLPIGIIFELPVVIFFLTKIGLVTPPFLKQYRKHAMVVILILAAVLTPPDPTTQILIAFPLYFLFEISIVISQRVYKKMEEREKLESADGKK